MSRMNWSRTAKDASIQRYGLTIYWDTEAARRKRPPRKKTKPRPTTQTKLAPRKADSRSVRKAMGAAQKAELRKLKALPPSRKTSNVRRHGARTVVVVALNGTSRTITVK